MLLGRRWVVSGASAVYAEISWLWLVVVGSAGRRVLGALGILALLFACFLLLLEIMKPTIESLLVLAGPTERAAVSKCKSQSYREWA